MSSNPPPPPLLNGLVAIIPASRLHYSPHSIDLKSDLSISTHTHAKELCERSKAMRLYCEKVDEPLNFVQQKSVPFCSKKNTSKVFLNVLLLFSIINIEEQSEIL